MNRLETVSNIWKGARHNYRHGIVDVGRLHLVLGDGEDFFHALILAVKHRSDPNADCNVARLDHDAFAFFEARAGLLGDQDLVLVVGQDEDGFRSRRLIGGLHGLRRVRELLSRPRPEGAWRGALTKVVREAATEQ